MENYIEQIGGASSVIQLREIYNKCKNSIRNYDICTAFMNRIGYLQSISLRQIDIITLEDFREDIEEEVSGGLSIRASSGIHDTSKYLNQCLKQVYDKDYYLIGDYPILIENDLLERTENALILRALDCCDYNRRRTAIKLGTTRTTLLAKINKILKSRGLVCDA